MEDLNPLYPFQRALRFLDSELEFLELSHFCKPCSDKRLPKILPLPFQISFSLVPLPNQPPPIIPKNIPLMAFFANAIDSPIKLQGALNDLPKNPKKLCPRFIYEETRIAKDHIKVSKEICNQKQVQQENVVLCLFPYSLGEVAFNWYVNLPPGCIQNWITFEIFFLHQFKIFVNPTMIHHQII